MKRIIFTSTLLIGLTACGFHPRGSYPISDSVGAIRVSNSDSYSPLTDGLQTAVDRANADKTNAGEGAAILKVHSEKWTNARNESLKSFPCFCRRGPIGFATCELGD